MGMICAILGLSKCIFEMQHISTLAQNSNMPYLAYFQDFQFLISDFHHIDFDRAQFIIHVYICTFSLTDTESIKTVKHGDLGNKTWQITVKFEISSNCGVIRKSS